MYENASAKKDCLKICKMVQLKQIFGTSYFYRALVKLNIDIITMRKNLPKTLDQLIFCKYTLVFSKCSQIY